MEDQIESVGGVNSVKLSIAHCEPNGVTDRDVGLQFTKHDNGKVEIIIKETKRGGRTYHTRAVIDHDVLAKVLDALDRGPVMW